MGKKIAVFFQFIAVMCLAMPEARKLTLLRTVCLGCCQVFCSGCKFMKTHSWISYVEYCERFKRTAYLMVSAYLRILMVNAGSSRGSLFLSIQ